MTVSDCEAKSECDENCRPRTSDPVTVSDFGAKSEGRHAMMYAMALRTPDVSIESARPPKIDLVDP